MAESNQDAIMTSVQPSPTQQKQKPLKGHAITTKTIKTPPFSYACLELISEPTSSIELDDLTVRSYITAAFTQYLGLTGSAMSVDILKVEGSECWIRVPREDLGPAMAAVGGWVGGNEESGRVGWKVKASGNWLSNLVGNRGVEKIWSG